ncbi:MAG: FtsH protease activity modulator HflK [Haemophilus parainfluenzae]|mgnify:FL=1|uniref:FtsH protease activity modulator HflK n=1 Tax=uncultured Haemophilus sp. TaxID=237779 RepID=UPI001CB3CAED|nr:FtsH protease activity modulator HflK [uncultured Haemophilus sp.]MBF1218307.1 FtsH protease activity modulator HflK [Haemophilus parainfluenzae]MBS5162297.1 FtsH protease activity modulator HflK [Haemophilus parainfluenzae]
MSQNGPDQDPWGKPGQSSGPKQSDNSSDKQNENGWGARDNKNQEQSPPDIEEVFNNLLKKLGGGNKKGGSNNTSPNIPSFNLGKILPIAAVIGGIIWGASGFYTIKEAERGVTLRFGEFHSIVQPGLNWKPTFIDKVIPVNVEQVRELKTQGAMLTKDENMVKVEMTVQYRVQNPEKYLFSVSNADNSLGQATDSALRYVIGHMTMNDVLTTGRAVVREDTWKALNDIIKPYDMGLEVIDVNFQSARPPEEVKDAFDDAIKAQEDEQRYIREAEAYAREKEPIARGDAQRIVEEATAYKDRVVLDAQGEVERLQRLLPEFKAAPDLLKERLYIQTMEKVMANTPKVMLDSNNGNNLTVLPLEQLMSKKTAKPVTTTSESAVSSAPVSTQERRVETQTVQPVQSNEGIRQGRFN